MLNVHRNHGEKGYGGWRRGRHCHHQNDSCIKMGSNESHFNVSLIVRDKVTRQCPQTTTFEGKGEVYSNRGSSAYQPHALPLGQTGSHSLLFLAYQRLCVTYCVSVIYSVVLQTRILMDNSCWPRLLDENTGRISLLAVQIFDESPIMTHSTQHAVCIDPQVDQLISPPLPQLPVLSRY